MVTRTAVGAKFRPDDSAIVINTEASVSHAKKSGVWISAFSLAIPDAEKLRDDLSKLIAEHAQPEEPAQST